MGSIPIISTSLGMINFLEKRGLMNHPEACTICGFYDSRPHIRPNLHWYIDISRELVNSDWLCCDCFIWQGVCLTTFSGSSVQP